MPLRLHTQNVPPGFPAEPSIRDALERDAWRHHHELATRLARRKGLDDPGHRSLRWQDRVLLILGIVLLSLLLMRVETAQADADWGLELISPLGRTTSLALETRIDADITGLVARVNVSQAFENRGADWAEGIYRFPLPDGAAVDRMQIQVGDRVIEGEIQRREEAKRVYQQAKAAGKIASLVEQQRSNQYESRLANIGPGETVHIHISFLVNVEWQDGAFSLRLPMTFTPRWEPAAYDALEPAPPGLNFSSGSASGHAGLALDLLLRTRIGYAAIESRYHDVDIQPVLDGYQVTLLEAAYWPDRDFELSWTPDFAATPRPELLTWDGGDAIYAQLMVVPPKLDALGPQAREVVFIIDTSGSMEGGSLQQARAALLEGLQQLDSSDQFNLVQFNSDFEVLFAASAPADSRHLELARDYLGDLEADGGTFMAPALKAAFALPEAFGLLRQVVFITDGSVGNEQELLLQIAEELGQARLFTVGIGSAPNSGFMRKAAEIGRGSHTRISKLDEVTERMNALWGRIRHPALSDICVDWGVEAEYYPEVIPDLYGGEPLWLTARMPLMPRDILLCGEFNGSHWEHRTAPRPSEGAETLATLWARKKIEALEDSRIFGVEADVIREEVTGLALAHGLLTRYTSLVAVDRTPVRIADETLQSTTVPSLLPAGSTAATAGFPRTATGWPAQAALSLLTLLIATALFLFSGARLPLDSSRVGPGTSPH